MFFYGFNENDEKIYYDTRSNKITMKQLFDEEPVSENLTFNSLDEELKYIGFDDSEIAKILTKMANIDNTNSNIEPVTSTNPTTGQTTTNPKGSLVSNSAQSLKNTTLYQESRMATEQAKLSLMSSANEVQKKQLDMMDYNLMVQGQILGALYDLNKNLEKLTTATTNQKLELSTSSLSMGNLNVQVQPLVDAINESVTNQKETNAKIVENLDKKNEHLDFLKDGLSTLKDSSGKVIKPREVQAKNHAEHQIYKTSENTFDWKSSLVETYTDLESNFDPSNLGFGTEGDNLLTLLTKLVSFDPKKFETDESKIFGKAKT